MTFLRRVLEPPSYGWEGRPSAGRAVREVLVRINIAASRKRWLAFSNWFWTLGLGLFAVAFFARYFSWLLAGLGFLYGMVWMGSHGTLWLHRYGSHRAFVLRHAGWRFVLRHLSIKIVPEEIYIVSHHVHHALPDRAGDPYDATRGAAYCFFADTNHQPIAQDLSPADYRRAVKLVAHTGLVPNSYDAYRRWGSITHPLRLGLLFAGNWAFWYAAFWGLGILSGLGGHALACAMFGGAFFWAIGIRTFNFAGHGGGQARHRDGFDFNRRDLSINGWWPGLVAGEWHNNHHLFPRSARAGFLPGQLDLPFLMIAALHRLGVVTSYRDDRERFARIRAAAAATEELPSAGARTRLVEP